MHPRILHIITTLTTGGAERALYNVLAGGLTEYVENHVISLSDLGNFGPKIERLGVPVEGLRMRSSRPSASGLWLLYRLLQKIQPDVIQGWMYHGNLAASVGQYFRLRRPVIAWNVRQTLYDLSHEKPATRWVIRSTRLLGSLPRAIIYNSYLSRAQHQDFGYPDGRGCVIANGFDLQQFRPDSAVGQAVRAQLHIPPDALVVGHIGRFHPMKDHAGFLRAVLHITAQRQDVHILMCGRNVTKANPALDPFLGELPMERVHMLGERDDVDVLLNAMDCLCSSSSRSEAFPNVLGEAMASGIPCVATDVGDSARIVDGTGIVVPPRDEAALAAALERMLAMPAAERRMLGEHARRRIEEHYSIGAAVRQYQGLYERLLENQN